MWQTREEEARQNELEKLIDWELKRQLTWSVVLLTTTLGLLILLASGILKQWVSVSRTLLVTINLVKTPLVIIFVLLLLGGVDLSFFRLANSLVNLRNYVIRIPSELHRQEFTEKAVLTWLYELFTERTEMNRFSLRAWLVWLLILIADLLLVWALFSA